MSTVVKELSKTELPNSSNLCQKLKMTAFLQITVLCKIRYGSQIGELDHIRATNDPTFKIRAQTKPFFFKSIFTREMKVVKMGIEIKLKVKLDQ